MVKHKMIFAIGWAESHSVLNSAILTQAINQE